LESDLSESYNYGIVPPPNIDSEPARLHPPLWQPTPAQVQAARPQVLHSAAILLFMVFSCVLVFAIATGWRF